MCGNLASSCWEFGNRQSGGKALRAGWGTPEPNEVWILRSLSFCFPCCSLYILLERKMLLQFGLWSKVAVVTNWRFRCGCAEHCEIHRGLCRCLCGHLCAFRWETMRRWGSREPPGKMETGECFRLFRFFRAPLCEFIFSSSLVNKVWLFALFSLGVKFTVLSITYKRFPACSVI